MDVTHDDIRRLDEVRLNERNDNRLSHLAASDQRHLPCDSRA